MIDVRPFIDLWDLESEISRSNELRRKLSNAHLTATDVSELVFDEDWPSMLRKQCISDLGIKQSCHNVCFFQCI